jgi:hypothetical protein
MPQFEVLARETVYYRVVFEAADEQDAREKIHNGEIDIGEPVDSDWFEIDDVIEQPDEFVQWYVNGVNSLEEENGNA